MIRWRDLDLTIGKGSPKPLSLPKDHPNLCCCPYCGAWMMFRWGRHDFRAYHARAGKRTVRSTGITPHWTQKRCPSAAMPQARLSDVTAHTIGQAAAFGEALAEAETRVRALTKGVG